MHKILVCGDVEGKNHLTCGAYEKIDEATFERLLHSYTLYFDPSGGACEIAFKEIPNGEPVGSLPAAELQYNTFTGWYLSNGTRVTENTVFSDGQDRTVYARYTPNTLKLTLSAEGGSCSTASLNVTCGKPVGELPVPVRDYYSFDGWYTKANGGTRITASTVFDTDDPVTAYAHWTPHDVSGWVPITFMPGDAQVVNTKWKYDLTSYTTSKSSTMSGWTQYKSTWEWGSYGSWSGWSDSQYSSSDSRQVETRSVADSYNLVSYTCGNSAGYRCYLKYPQNGYTVRSGPNYQTVSAEYLNGLPEIAQGGWWDGSGNASFQGYVIGPGTGYAYDWCVPFFIDSVNYKTQWRYRDRSKVYTYYFSKVEARESTVYPTGENISNIVEWVQYRIK